MAKSIVKQTYEAKLEAQKTYAETINQLTKSLEDYVFLYLSCDEDMKGDKVRLSGRIYINVPGIEENENLKTDLYSYFSIEYQNPETTCSQIMLTDNGKFSFGSKLNKLKSDEFLNVLASIEPKEYHLKEFESIEAIFKKFPYLCTQKDNPLSKWNYACDTHILSGRGAANRPPKKVMIHDSLLKIISQEAVTHLKEISTSFKEDNAVLIDLIEKKIMAIKLDKNLPHSKTMKKRKIGKI